MNLVEPFDQIFATFRQAGVFPPEIPFGTLRKRAEISINKRLGIDIPEHQAKLIGKYSIPVAEGKLALDEAVEEIRHASE